MTYRTWLATYNLTLFKASNGMHQISGGTGLNRISYDFVDMGPSTDTEAILGRLAERVRGLSLKATLERELLELQIGAHKVDALLAIGGVK